LTSQRNTLAVDHRGGGGESWWGSKEWSQQQIQAALSQEALTAAVMQRYHVNNSIKRELGAKLGKLQAA
jgi:hypothetical protein